MNGIMMPNGQIFAYLHLLRSCCLSLTAKCALLTNNVLQDTKGARNVATDNVNASEPNAKSRAPKRCVRCWHRMNNERR